MTSAVLVLALGLSGQSPQAYPAAQAPAKVAPALQEHLERVRVLHRQELARGHGRVFLPEAYERKSAGAATAWAWQYVFPAPKASVDPRSGEVRRHHAGELVARTWRAPRPEDPYQAAARWGGQRTPRGD